MPAPATKLTSGWRLIAGNLVVDSVARERSPEAGRFAGNAALKLDYRGPPSRRRASGARNRLTATSRQPKGHALVSASGVRHVSVDANNDLWVSGTWADRTFDLLDTTTGGIKRHESAVGFGGFGGFVDDYGVLWSAQPLMRWNPALPLAGANGTNWMGYAGDSYGICHDSQGKVWSTSATTTKLRKYDASGVLLAELDPGLAGAKTCVTDKSDDLWIAYGEDAAAKVAHLKSDGTYVGSVTAGAGASGLSLDARGKVWATNCAGHTASRIDPLVGAVGPDGATHIGQADLTTVDLGGSPLDYGNMTGSVQASGPASGSWTALFNAGDATSKWGHLQWSSWVCGDQSLTMRVASSLDGTTFSAPLTVTNGTPFSLPDGAYLQVVASFGRSSNGSTATLSDVTIGTSDRPITPKTNHAPVITGQQDYTVTLPSRVRLIASVCDDGLPGGRFGYDWHVVSAPPGGNSGAPTPYQETMAGPLSVHPVFAGPTAGRDGLRAASRS
jgi:streptogramin lyase